MFLHLSVSHSVHGGGDVSQHILRQTTPSPGRHPLSCRWLLQRTVRILLECILVSREFYHCDDPRGVRLPVFTGSTGQQQDQRLLPPQGQQQRARGALFRLR